jgi:malate dehydrogenase (oxaloacetate-decarboxylating)
MRSTVNTAAKNANASATALRADAEALQLHARYRGKIQMLPKCPVQDPKDFNIWYTPGVAAPCREIHANPAAVYSYTNRGNSIAVVSDGSRVLGLGDIGPAAGLPVMEGKALLFKVLGGVDAVPLCIDARDPDTFIRVVQSLEPTFGGINLEDISQPKCFRILETLRATMGIPVWHDDQQGSATAVLAGLSNALRIVGRDLAAVKIALIGMGAANVAVYRLLKAVGADTAGIVACDSVGILHPGRSDVEAGLPGSAEKWRVCRETNADSRRGGVAEAMRGADVCIAFTRSGPGIIEPAWVAAMAPKAIVFAAANPVPEIWPSAARGAGAAVVATGRGDFPNQVNNALAFPGIFRGVLDVQSRTISDEMAVAAALEIAACLDENHLSAERIVPPLDDPHLAPRVAAAVAMKSQEQGLARVQRTRSDLLVSSAAIIREARAAAKALIDAGILRPIAKA